MTDQQEIVIQNQLPDDVEEVSQLLTEVWLDTYPNDEAGISREWVTERRALFGSPEKNAERKEWLAKNPNNKQHSSFVTKTANGKIVGFAHAYVDDEGMQNLGAIYVARQYHGMGVATKLIAQVFKWADMAQPIKVGVVSYNERAKSFYRKWGFEEIPGSETLYAEKLPEIFMIRKGDRP